MSIALKPIDIHIHSERKGTTSILMDSKLYLHVVALVMTSLQEVAVCLMPLCLKLVAPLARLAILFFAAVRASIFAFSWAA